MRMSRELHVNSNVELTAESLQDVIDVHATGDVLVVAPRDDRLTKLIPVAGQVTLGSDQLQFSDGAEFHISDPLPVKHDERLPFETDCFDIAVMLFSLCGYFQRAAPFFECTRIVRGGGTILTATGLQPTADPDHDAKWWVPASSHVAETRLKVLNADDFETALVVSLFTAKAGEHGEGAVDATAETAAEIERAEL